MNLKEVLGDAYKEGMTFEEVEAALEKVTVPEDNSAEIERAEKCPLQEQQRSRWLQETAPREND